MHKLELRKNEKYSWIAPDQLKKCTLSVFKQPISVYDNNFIEDIHSNDEFVFLELLNNDKFEWLKIKFKNKICYLHDPTTKKNYIDYIPLDQTQQIADAVMPPDLEENKSELISFKRKK
jgi:hypothetical protein